MFIVTEYAALTKKFSIPIMQLDDIDVYLWHALELRLVLEVEKKVSSLQNNWNCQFIVKRYQCKNVINFLSNSIAWFLKFWACKTGNRKFKLFLI